MQLGQINQILQFSSIVYIVYSVHIQAAQFDISEVLAIQFIMGSDKIQSQNSKKVRKKTVTFCIKRMSVLKSAKTHLKILG